MHLRRLSPLVAGAGVLVASISMVAGLIGVPLDAFHLTIGQYAGLDGDGGTSLVLTLLALSSAGLLAGMRAVRAPISGWPERLVLGWALSLLGAALLPGTVAADVMIVAALVGLAGAAALMVRRFGDDERWRPAARPFEWLSLGAGGALAVLTYVALPGHRVLIGLVEWSLLGIEAAVLAVAAARLAWLSWTLAGTPEVSPGHAASGAPAAQVPVTLAALAPRVFAAPVSRAVRAPAAAAGPAVRTPVAPAQRVPAARMPPRTPAMSASMSMATAVTTESAASFAGSPMRVLSRQ